jgi:hypothetical protein
MAEVRGIVPEHEVRLVVTPPSQMFPMMKLGYLDGFASGEPWSSLVIDAGVGVCVATSSQLAPLHPEKVLMVRQSFAMGRGKSTSRWWRHYSKRAPGVTTPGIGLCWQNCCRIHNT